MVVRVYYGGVGVWVVMVVVGVVMGGVFGGALRPKRKNIKTSNRIID